MGAPLRSEILKPAGTGGFCPDPVRVMIVDDSLTVRTVFSRMIKQEHDMVIVGTANTAEAGLSDLPGAAPDVQLASTAFACPDQGGAGVPLAPSNIDPTKLPPGFVPPTDPAQRAAVTYALAQLGKPYIWGAKGPNGFDCSGLMLAAWAAAGVPIPAGTVNQKNAGTPAGPATIAPGDLVFIPGSLGSPTNPRPVGMYVGNGLVVNAYDSSTGVILQPLSDWTDKITHVRHIAGPAGASAAAPVPAARAETALAEAAGS